MSQAKRLDAVLVLLTENSVYMLTFIISQPGILSLDLDVLESILARLAPRDVYALLKTNFTTSNSSQIQVFVTGLGEYHNDINRFKLSTRDFLRFLYNIILNNIAILYTKKIKIISAL